MNFEELGLTLKRQRETLGLTIEEVMEATKISRRNIVAMETGNRDDLPHPVYTKGFVRSYARYLGLDAEELCMVVDRDFQFGEDEPLEQPYDVSPGAEKAFHEPVRPKGESRKGSWMTFLIVLMLVGVVVYLVVNLNKSDDSVPTAPPVTIEETAPEAASTEPDFASDSAAAPSEGVEESAGQEMPEVSAVPEAEQPVPEVEAVPQAQLPAAPVRAAAGETVDDEDETSGTEEDQPKYAHMMVITATSDKGCWVGVWRGDAERMARDFVLKKGEPLRLMFNTPRRIRIGNVAGVTVTYNGAPYSLDDTKGNIQTLRFGYSD